MRTADDLARRFVKTRKGISTPVLLVTISIALLLTVAAIDLAQLSHQRHQMQIGADAAALAATAKLHDRRWLYLGPDVAGQSVGEQLMMIQPWQDPQLVEAQGEAIRFAAFNQVADRQIVLEENVSNDPQGDMMYGFVADPTHEQINGTPSADGGFNSMMVRASRRKAAGDLPLLWMARQVGMANLEMKVVSQAVLDQRLYGFRPLLMRGTTGELTNVTQVPVPILPIAVMPNIDDLTMFEEIEDVAPTNLWWAKGPEDNYFVDPFTRQVTPGSDGIAEMVIRIGTDSSQSATNSVKTRRGALIGFGNGDTSPSAIVFRGLSGLNADELPGGEINLSNDQNLPTFPAVYNVSQDDAPAYRTGLINAGPSLIGQPRILPIGAPAGGSSFVFGGFVAGAIVDCLQDSGDGSLLLVVQPCLLQTPTALTGGDNPRNPWIGKLLLNR